MKRSNTKKNTLKNMKRSNTKKNTLKNMKRSNTKTIIVNNPDGLITIYEEAAKKEGIRKWQTINDNQLMLLIGANALFANSLYEF